MAKNNESKTSSSSGADLKKSAATKRWKYKGPFCINMKFHDTGEELPLPTYINDEEKILAFQQKYPDRAHWFVKE